MSTSDQTARLIAHYDKLSARYESLYDGPSRLSRFYRARQLRLCQMLEGLSGRTALEVGCAAGLMVGPLLAKGMDYYGVDISPGMIRVCRKRFHGVAAACFAVADGRRLPFPAGAFDVAVSLGMLEYTEDEEQAVRETARVLRVRGTLILSGITKWSPYNLFNRLIYRRVRHWKPACIVREYHTEGEYRRLLTRVHMDVVDAVYFDFPPLLASLERSLPLASVVGSNNLRPSPLRQLGNGFLIRAQKAS